MLDAAKAAPIRATAGERTQPELADRFGVDRTSVGQVIRGVIWREEPAA